jgi:4-hydroxy-2-oxoheptanedioate aldolase
MKPASILRKKISGSDPVLGVLSTFHFWPGLVEIAIEAGFDYLIIDLEHLTHNHEKIAEACAFGRREGFPVLIRPPSAEFTPVRLALDLGPCGLLIPYVESVETLNEVRDAVYMKPRGRRRPGGPGNAWVKDHDYNYSTWRREVEDDLIILTQIESKKGLENVDAIAQDPLTTALAIGPYDLSADLGICWEPDHPLLVEAFAQVKQSAAKVGKNMWVIGDGATMMKRGFNFICLTESTMQLQTTLTQMVADSRKAAQDTKDAPSSDNGETGEIPI